MFSLAAAGSETSLLPSTDLVPRGCQPNDDLGGTGIFWRIHVNSDPVEMFPRVGPGGPLI
jgi:hypothetical protein